MKLSLRSFPVLVGILLILLAAQVAFSIYSFYLIGKTHDESQDMNVIGTMRMLTHRLGRSTMEILAGHDSPALRTQMESDIRRFEALAKGLEQGDQQLKITAITSPRQAELLQDIITEWHTYKQYIYRIMEEDIENQPGKREYVINLTFSGDKIVTLIDELIYVDQQESRNNIEQITSRSLFIALISTMLIMFLWYYAIKKGFLQPLNKIIPGFDLLAEGGLPKKIEPQGCDAVHHLAEAHNNLVASRTLLLNKLTGDLGEVVENTKQILALSLRLSSTIDTMETTEHESPETTDYVPDAVRTLHQLEKELQLFYSQENKYSLNSVKQSIADLSGCLTNIQIQVNSLQEQNSSLLNKQKSTQQQLAQLENSARDTLKTTLMMITYTRGFRATLQRLEASLTDQQLLGLFKLEQQLARQQLHLYVLGYGQISTDDFELDALQKWINTRGKEIFADHPNFSSLQEHYDRYLEELDNLLLADTQAQKAEKLAQIENFSSMVTIDLERLSNTLTERNANNG